MHGSPFSLLQEPDALRSVPMSVSPSSVAVGGNRPGPVSMPRDGNVGRGSNPNATQRVARTAEPERIGATDRVAPATPVRFNRHAHRVQDALAVRRTGPIRRSGRIKTRFGVRNRLAGCTGASIPISERGPGFPATAIPGVQPVRGLRAEAARCSHRAGPVQICREPHGNRVGEPMRLKTGFPVPELSCRQRIARNRRARDGVGHA